GRVLDIRISARDGHGAGPGISRSAEDDDSGRYRGPPGPGVRNASRSRVTVQNHPAGRNRMEETPAEREDEPGRRDGSVADRAAPFLGRTAPGRQSAGPR